MLRLALLFAILAVAFDAVGALIAKLFAFIYGQLALLAVLLFVAMGFYAGRTLPIGRALVAIAIAAVAEATLGWYVAAAIGPARILQASATVIVGIAIIGILIDTAAGALGALIGRRAARGT